MATAARDFSRGVAIHCPQTKQENLWAGQWLAQRIPDFGPHNLTALVVTLHGEVVAVWGYSKPIFNRIELSLASDTPRWVTRSSLLYCLAPPFVQWGYNGIYTAVPKSNKRCRKLLEGSNFRYEATLREAGRNNEHIIIYGMLEKEYGDLIRRWSGEEDYMKFKENVVQ